MQSLCNHAPYDEEEAKSSFEEVALDNMVVFLKRAFWEVISSDEVLPPEIRLAFKIDTVSMLRKAFDVAIKEFEDDSN